MKYKDFSIKVGQRRDEGFAISIASPAGEANDFITSTRDLDEIFASLRSLAQSLKGDGADSGFESGPTSKEAGGAAKVQTIRPIDIGRKLFGILFVGRVRTLFYESIGGIQGTDYGLRIKLHIDPENSDIARLASLPWELLYREETRDYLSLSSKTPLVRYLDVQRPFELLPFKPPLRVLVVVANPSGTEPLDLEKERQSIEQSWGNKADVEVDFLDTATIQELSKKLDEADYHVLHYMGHGGFDPKQGVGVLAMEKVNGRVDVLDGRTLGIMLRDETSIRLVFLNACDTGKLGHTTDQDPFAGVASALVMAGIPAVVAMQFPISDRAALAFTECFYPQIAKGVPVDASVAEGRKAIRINNRESMEWAIPVLFMRSPSGHLFTRTGPGHQQPANQVSPVTGDNGLSKEAPTGGNGTGGTGGGNKIGRSRALTIAVIVAVAVIVAGIVKFPEIQSWLSSEQDIQQTNANESSELDIAKPEETSESSHDVTSASLDQPPILEKCGRFVALQGCEIPLARKICAAYTALESGDMTATEPASELTSRRRNSLYTKEADNEAMKQFLNNVGHAYQQAGGKDVQFANFQNPRSFWRETPDASIVLSAVINVAGPELENGEIPDGESNIYYHDDFPLSIDFEVKGNKWRSVRNYHAAAFYYYDAISAKDIETKRISLELAVARMTDRCSE